MVCITEHRGETSEGFSMEEEVASSTPQSSGHPMLGAAVVRPARRRTPGWVSRTPSGDTPAGALSVARELLRHLPSPVASPGAMRQWRDDVDRLLGMAHPGSIRPRPRSPLRRHEASASERTPSVRTAPTGDLLMELNRRCVEGDTQVPPEGPGDLRDKLNANVRAEMPVSLWRRRVSAAAASGKIPLRSRHEPQGMLDSRPVSRWLE
jgi:hypothetical protein